MTKLQAVLITLGALFTCFFLGDMSYKLIPEETNIAGLLLSISLHITITAFVIFFIHSMLYANKQNKEWTRYQEENFSST